MHGMSDFNGVWCAPFANLNVTVKKPGNIDVSPTHNKKPTGLYSYLRQTAFRYRPPMPGILDSSRRLHEAGHTLTIVTSRNLIFEHAINSWLDRHGLANAFDRVILNDSPYIGPEYKRRMAEILRPDYAIDDDPRTAAHLAQSGLVPVVFIIDWPETRHADIPKSVVRIPHVGAIVDWYAARGVMNGELS